MLVAAIAMCGSVNSSVFADTSVGIGEQFDVLAGDVYFSQGLFNNQGTVNNWGHIQNEGLFYNQSTANLNIYSDFWNFGTLDNAGQINFYGYSTISVSDNGQLYNSGSISGVNQDYGILRFEYGGYLRNSGDLSYLYLEISDQTNVLNTGTISDANIYGISGSGVPGVQFVNTGTITNSVIDYVGGMENSGYIGGDPAQGTGTSISVRDRQTFTNSSSGLIDLISPNFGGNAFNLEGSFYNQGSVVAHDGTNVIDGARGSAVFYNQGDFTNVGSRLEIRNGGVIRNLGTMTNGDEFGIYGYPEIDLQHGSFNPSTLDNSGTLENHAAITGEGQVINSGLMIHHEFGRLDVAYMENSGRLEAGGEIFFRDRLVVTETGTLAPTNINPDYFYFNPLSIVGNVDIDGTLELEIPDLYGEELINISGVLDIGDTAVLDLSLYNGEYAGWMFGVGDSYDLLSADVILGDFSELVTHLLYDDAWVSLELEVYSDGFRDFLRLNAVEAAAPVPLPAAVWIFMTGLIGLTALARRKAH